MEDVQFIKDTPSDELIKKHLTLVFEVYHRLFGEVCTGCPAKVAGYINRIKNYKKDKAMSDQKKKEFLLKERAVIVIKGTSKVYSNANLTEEVAIKFLKKNPNRKQLFARLPKNIDELLKADDEGGSGSGDNKVETASQLAKKGRKELDQIAADLELNPKDYSNKEEVANAIFAKREELKNSSGTGTDGANGEGGAGDGSGDGGEGGSGSGDNGSEGQE